MAAKLNKTQVKRCNNCPRGTCRVFDMARKYDETIRNCSVRIPLYKELDEELRKRSMTRKV